MALLSLTVGTLGYMLIEQMGLRQAFYMTVITFSTTGFEESKTLSPSRGSRWGGQSLLLFLSRQERAAARSYTRMRRTGKSAGPCCPNCHLSYSYCFSVVNCPILKG